MTREPASTVAYCTGCNSLIAAEAAACPRCGSLQPSAPPIVRKRSVAVLLAYFLGAFGAHKFYLGQPWQGLVYALFCWTLIPVLVAQVDFIRLAIMSDEKFNVRFR